GVKRVTRPMLGFKAFDAAQNTLVGIELMHMIKKKQRLVEAGEEGRTAAELFHSLAASFPPQTGATAPSRPPGRNLRHNPRQRAYRMQGFKSPGHAQRFLSAYGPIA